MSERERGPQGRDRRRGSGDFRVQPRSSPVNVLVLAVVGGVLVTAAAGVLWGGFSDRTPHGRLLGALQDVATAQESLWSVEHRFAGGVETLPVETPSGVELRLTRGDATTWEAVASDPEVGLACRQSGVVGDTGRPERRQPVCFTTR